MKQGEPLSREPPILELDRVSFRQQSADILRDVSWQLWRGQRWAILGPNGSGKTTLLRIACGYRWPTTGAVRRLGQELLDLRELRLSIGWVTSELVGQIPPADTALETVVSGKFAEVGLKRIGTPPRPTERDFDDARRLLERLDCGSLANKQFAVLSQGERQQTLVARAQMVDPLAVILDEPCAGMDPGVRERFLAWVESLASGPSAPAIVLVTHHVEEIMPALDHVLVMQEGRVAASGATCEVISPSLLERVYGVRVNRLEKASGRYWPIWH